jgi:dihydroorotate dehydrogenase
MPDWSYRTVLRPVMLAMGAERARRLATGTLRTLSRLPAGLEAIDFLGHMRPDPRLRLANFAGPVALGSLIDPAGEAVAAFARFGAGLIEVGPVALKGNSATPQWRVDLAARTITASTPVTVDVEEVERNLAHAKLDIPVCVRIAETDAESVRRIVERLSRHAAMFVVDAPNMLSAAAGPRPVMLSIGAAGVDAARTALREGADGVWVRGEGDALVRALRSEFPDALIIAGGVNEPDDVRRLLAAGANIAAVDAGLVCGGPGLVKRCNEAIVSTMPAAAPPQSLNLDAARSAWFWAFLLGVAMLAGGILAIVIASTRIILPYDESLAGMTRAQLRALNPRLLAFMAHDRVSLAGSMISIGIIYAALAWSGIRHGAHWAHVTVIVSAISGFFSFFLFLGFGYFDPFHAFVTAILTQFTLLCMVMPLSPRQPPVAEWRETPAWRRGQWGQLLFILMGVALTGAGMVISFIGCTSVFVETDLAFMRASAVDLRRSFENLVPLVAHDRASLGGMLIANGLAVWLSAQWGFRAGARWLWLALAWGGNIAFACATVVHFVVGYNALMHLAPAILGWITWNVALALTSEWVRTSRQDR